MPDHPVEETAAGSTSLFPNLDHATPPTTWNSTTQETTTTITNPHHNPTNAPRHHRQDRQGVQGLHRLGPPAARYARACPPSDHPPPLTQCTDDVAAAHKANPVRSTPSLLDRVQHVGWTLTGRQGPVHADNMPEKASKEELKKRAEELNK